MRSRVAAAVPPRARGGDRSVVPWDLSPTPTGVSHISRAYRARRRSPRAARPQCTPSRVRTALRHLLICAAVGRPSSFTASGAWGIDRKPTRATPSRYTDTLSLGSARISELRGTHAHCAARPSTIHLQHAPTTTGATCARPRGANERAGCWIEPAWAWQRSP